MPALVAIIVIASVAVGAFYLLAHFVGLQGSLIWGALAASVAWLVKQDIERRREHERVLSQQKREQYLQFIDFVNSTFKSNGTPVPSLPDDLRRWSMRLSLFGSDEVVKAWSTVAAGTAGIDTVRLHGRLLLAMRRDCGHYKTKLSPTDVLKSFVNDAEQHRAFLDS